MPVVLENLNKVVEYIKDSQIYMIIGHGSKNQIKYPDKINLVNIMKNIKDNSVILYFGDEVNQEKPDIGYIFQLINEKYKKSKNLKFVMIQINTDDAKKYTDFTKGQSFVDAVYWHDDFADGPNKWGGVNEKGEPQSNTKQWIELHKRLKITKIYALGGGPVTLEEIKLGIQHKIPIGYIPVIRRFLGDSKTQIMPNMSRSATYGIVDDLFCTKCKKFKEMHGGKKSTKSIRDKHPKLFKNTKLLERAKRYLRRDYGDKLKNMSKETKDSILYQMMIH